MDFHVLEPLPVPRTLPSDPFRSRAEKVAGRLAAVDGRYDHWASEVGVPVASVSDTERPDLLAELDAAVALLYGLDEDDLRVIYETFHEGADYSAHSERVIDQFRRLRKEAE